MERERETQFGSQCGRIHTQVQPGMSYRSSHSSISYTCQIITLMKVTGEPNQLTWQTVLPKLVLSHRPKKKSTNTGLAQKTQKALYNFLRIYLVLLPNSWKQTAMPKISLQDDFSHLYIRTPVNIQRIRSGYSPCLPVHAAHNRRFSMSDVCKQVGNMLHGSGQGLRLGRSMQEAGYDAKDTLQNPFLLIWLKIWQWARTATSIFLSSSGSQTFYLSSLSVCKNSSSTLSFSIIGYLYSSWYVPVTRCAHHRHVFQYQFVVSTSFGFSCKSPTLLECNSKSNCYTQTYMLVRLYVLKCCYVSGELLAGERNLNCPDAENSS